MAAEGELNEYEVKVLREVNGEQTDVIYGAALMQVVEILKGNGYIERGLGKYRLTDKGEAYLRSLNDDAGDRPSGL